MRKIISILVALGVVLGLTLVAVPTAAAPVCPTGCTPVAIADLLGPPNFCAGQASNYLLGFVLPVTLIPGTDSLSVDFPAGTDLTAVLAANVFVTSMTLGGPFSPAAITKTGTHLEFVVPIGFWPISLPAGDGIIIEVDGVVNPTTAGKVCLFVDYKFACCPAVQFDCVQYTISPAVATLGFHFDFGATYPGISADFVPPFKACGQVDYGHEEVGIGWVTDFDLILTEDIVGCHPPCTAATMWFVLTKCPAGETVNFDFAGLPFTLTATDVGKVKALPPVALPDPWADIVWTNWIHFSSPGDYEIVFYLQCPAVPCLAGAQIVAQKAMPAKVYQWKDAGKIILDEKWNLVSLPLVPFDTSIANLVKSLPAEALDKDTVDELISIHHYDRTGCPDVGTWKVYGGGQTSLSTMEDGKSYWVRMTYPGVAMPYTWWVWGTALPMPPASPKQYPVCKGWNMLGFTSLVDDPVTDYLWNWAGTPYVVYGWLNTGDWTTSGWDYIDPLLPDNLITGQGYWAAFPAAGYVYVPGP